MYRVHHAHGEAALRSAQMVSPRNNIPPVYANAGDCGNRYTLSFSLTCPSIMDDKFSRKHVLIDSLQEAS